MTVGTASTCCTWRRRGWRGCCSVTPSRAGSPTWSRRQPEVLLLLGADEVDQSRFAKAFKVYIGHHGDKGAAGADLVLPGAAYAEKHGIYVNIEGRVQRAERATFPPGDAREDWTILRACPNCWASRCRSTPSTSCARRWSRTSRARPRRPDRFAVGAAEARRQGRGPGRLSDRGFLPDQRHLPRQPDHAPLLRGIDPRRGL